MWSAARASAVQLWLRLPPAGRKEARMRMSRTRAGERRARGIRPLALRGSRYCPTDAVSRGQMAVFLLKALEGAGYAPPACSGVFDDVSCPSQFAGWIEDLVSRNITAGCSAEPLLYCPATDVLRGQLATFLVKTFSLPFLW